MKDRAVRGTGDEKTTGWFINFYQQWSGLFKSTNWTDFTVIHLSFEYAPYSGRLEACAGLLGFQVDIQYVYNDKFNTEMKEIIAGIDSGETKTTPLSEVLERYRRL